MKKLEKLVYLEIKNKQLGVIPNTEYFDLYKSLTQNGKSEFGAIYKEIHQIFNRLNTNQELWGDGCTIHHIKDYDLKIASVSRIIMKIANNYGFTFKIEISPRFLNAYEVILGRDSLNTFLKGVNQIWF